jgi:HB1, ASXL, restriction endonuclease HTH domain
MDFLEAALTVLREEGRPLHWTAIQDLALKRGYIDPFEQTNVRQNLLAALSRAARERTIVKRGTGVFALPDESLG